MGEALRYNVVAPRVLNRRTAGLLDGVYVGRPSKFGNPFTIGRDGSRQAVIAKFEVYLQERPELLAAVRRELRGKSLLCWCTPKDCHADVLLRIANETTAA